MSIGMCVRVDDSSDWKSDSYIHSDSESEVLSVDVRSGAVHAFGMEEVEREKPLPFPEITSEGHAQ